MGKAYKFTLPRRLFNKAAAAAIRRGFAPQRNYLLTTAGRKTGRSHTHPVSLMEWAGSRYLVAPYGVRDWVKNARAAGRVTLTRASRIEEVTIEEVAPAEAAPVLKLYYEQESITRPYFNVPKDPTVADFECDADAHPVFRLTPVS